MSSFSPLLSPYRAFLADEKARLARLIQQLTVEGRQDEANLHKVKLNIVSIFETLAGADERASSHWDDFCQRYEGRFHTLPAQWLSHLEKARAHNDTSAQVIEEAKIETAAHLLKVFQSVKE